MTEANTPRTSHDAPQDTSQSKPHGATQDKPQTKKTPTRKHSAGAFATPHDSRKYWLVLTILIAVGALCAFGLLAYKNPMPVGTPQFWLLAERRMHAVIAMAVVAICQGMATVAFQTVTNNRIITPSIMGFESLYAAIHTTTVFLGGVAGLAAARSLPMFLLQIILMVGMAVLLYGWLLTGRKADMHATLLVGVVIGAGLGSVSSFMQRLLTPSEFDVLTARLFGSVNNSKPEYYPVAIPMLIGAAVLLYLASRKLNVMSLGRDVTTNLGLNHKALNIYILVLVTILMAVSTALVGPMTFLGFLVATLTYQFANTYDHRFLFPMAALMAFAVLTCAYFVMNHIFYAQGAVSIIIELVGGLVFLTVLLRKGRL
ncbi:iron chelate uptake ABC transporter family permease subunit [Corynebacterium sp. 320]|uniref:iron chelate uptake ABC transporter family permease subunit n=1 Tax=Corynebacterium TaxID=1716 RepID=UPI00125CC7C2|nr:MULTISPECIES: iron chelate uptake ABC transporter family permease subunit [Corynebacterium]KAB1504395.1 iron chelate uptake ABC transporter family permease subunit [Corynebacterium sp. 320]KAB1552506.1 iron chelate uptake ABC transporter family permease subunit [Corynebacterium sp. 321]KAB1554279.1 iron chelate uptake ABC transporter family permease subunit [Corynebacterium sp. 319]KAB3528531.1 iron chelate uptake ABC transporter family permease subunit [Corynebacterium sp. 250]KAB3539977.1